MTVRVCSLLDYLLYVDISMDKLSYKRQNLGIKIKFVLSVNCLHFYPQQRNSAKYKILTAAKETHIYLLTIE